MDEETEESSPDPSTSVAAKDSQPSSMSSVKKAKLEEGSLSLGESSAGRQPIVYPTLYETDKGESFTSLDDVDPHTTSLKIRALRDVSQLDRLGKLTKLESLEFMACHFSQGLPLIVTELVSLKHLKILCCRLTDLPPQISQLDRLQTFVILGEEWSTLPPVVCELRSLKELSITSRMLTDLPPVVSQLDQLQKLVITGSHGISTLPPVVLCELRSLKEINLTMCKLTALPAQMSQLYQLQKLDASYNDLSTLPPVVCELKSLKELDLSYCNLAELPTEFSNLKELQELSLKGNSFTSLPPAIYQLKKLQKLDLWSNRELKRMEKEIVELADLSVLDCYGCVSLKHPPYAVCQKGLSAVKKFFTNTVTPHSSETSDMESDLPELSSDDYDPVGAYLDFIQELDSFLDSVKVLDYMIYQDLNDVSKIIIAGPNISQLQDELNSVKTKNRKYMSFALVAKDSTPKSPESANMWIENYQPVKCLLSDKRKFPMSVIELMMRSSNASSHQPMFYGATTAHSFLTESQQYALRDDDHPSIVMPIWEELEGSCNEQEYIMSTESTETQPVDVVGPPYSFYRHWYPHTSNNSPLLDIAVFKYDQKPLQDDGWLSGNFDWRNGKDLEYLVPGPTDFRSLKEIESLEDLYSLRNRTVLCNQKFGCLLSPPIHRQRGAVLGRHLSFILDGEPLKPGDCGSLVYLMSDSADQPDCIVGMFIGMSTVEPSIHQAVILSANLAVVRQSQPFQQTELKIFQPSDALDTDSGEETSAAQSTHREEVDKSELVNAYVSFTEELNSFLVSETVCDYVIYQDLCDVSKIIVAGPDISRLNGRLSEVKRKDPRYRNFTVEAQDYTPDELDSPNMWIDNYQLVRCSLSDKDNSISVIELLLQGNSTDGRQSFYGATTAHSFLTESQQRTLMNDDQFSTVQPIWEELKDNSRERRYSLFPDNNRFRSVDLVGPPYSFYRHWRRQDDHKSPMLDIAVFELNQEQLQEGGWFKGEIDWRHGLSGNNPGLAGSGFKEVKEIESRADLESLRKRTIVCQQKTGRIIQPPIYVQDGEVLGLHLSFTIDGEPLKRGDCGSLVYLKTDDMDQHNCIVGMFVGKFKLQPAIHQAVILSKALRIVRESEPFQQMNLEIFHAEHPDHTEENCAKGMTEANGSSSYLSESSFERAGTEAVPTELVSQDVHPLDAYLSFTEELSSLLNSAKVKHFMIYEDLDVASKIIVAGPEVSQLQDELNSVKTKNKNYAEFDLVVKDSAPKPLDSPNMWIENYRLVRCCLSDGKTSRFSVELMMQSGSTDGCQPALYAATTAHSFHTESQQPSPINDELPSTVTPIWEAESAGIQLGNIVGPPYLFYCHWYPHTSNNSPLLDIAIFECNQKSLQVAGKCDEQNGNNFEHLTPGLTNFSSLKEIESLEVLYSLRNRRVLCNEKFGRILRPQVYGKCGQVLGRHLSFTLDKGQCLEPGDCGSLVYLLDDKADRPNCIVGMLFGKSTEDPRIYQAVILSAAFSVVRNSQPFQQMELKVFPLQEILSDSDTDQAEGGKKQPASVIEDDAYSKVQAQLKKFPDTSTISV